MTKKKGCYSPQTDCIPDLEVCEYCQLYQNKEEGIISRDILIEETIKCCNNCGLTIAGRCAVNANFMKEGHCSQWITSSEKS